MKNTIKHARKNYPLLRGSFAGTIFLTGLLQIINIEATFSQTISNESNKSSLKVIESNESSLRFASTFNNSNIKSLNVVTSVGNFSELSIEGYGSSNTIGEPKLPVLKQLIEVPIGADFDIQIVNYTIKDYNLKDLGIYNSIMPAQGPISKSGDPSKITFKYNKSVYNTKSFLNRSLVEVIPEGIMRGVRLARLEVSPVLYNPVDNSIRIYENLEVKITYKNSDLSETARLKENTYSPFFEGTFGPVVNHQPTKTRANFTKYPVKLVIVSDPMFKATLQPLIKWKIKKGFTVIEAYTDDIKVGKTTTSIQAYLKGLYTAGTASNPAPSFILLVGDVAQVPAFAGKANGGGHVTDFYYGECTGDKLPDMFYGRFSATSVGQLQPQIDKTLEYEQYLMPDPSFLNNVVMIAGVDADNAPKFGNGQINYGTSTYFNSTNGITSKTYLYPASGSSDSKIIADINAGVCYANYTAHGSPSGWYDPSFEVSAAKAMTNAHKYPLMVGNCCLTNKFETTECFGEALLRGVNKGAIGYIGGSNTSTWDEDFWFGVGYRSSITTNPVYSATQEGSYDKVWHTKNQGFNEWYFTQDQIRYSGLLAVTQSGSSESPYYWEIYHLMGDPTLMPYFSVPKKMPVTYTSPILIGATTFNVQTEPYAYAAISLQGVLYGVALADATGLAAITLSKPFTSNALADVVVTRQNRQPYIGTVNVGTSTGITEIVNVNNSLTVAPNPFQNIVRANYTLDHASSVQLIIYTISGQEIKMIVNESKQSAGSYTAEFDGSMLSNGVYYCVLRTDDKTNVQKIVLSK